MRHRTARRRLGACAAAILLAPFLGVHLASASDTTAPVLEDLSVTPATVDPDGAAPCTTFQVTAADDVGIVRGENSMIFFTSPSGLEGMGITLRFQEYRPGSVTTLDLASSFCPALGAEPGTWTINLSLSDLAGNVSAYATADLEALGLPSELTVERSGGPEDLAPPTWSCESPSPAWYGEDVAIACSAQDDGSELADPADAAFTLSTNVPVGTETESAVTDSRLVCDVAGNCTTAGPVGGIKVDKRAPDIMIDAPVDGAVFMLGEVIAADYACGDGGAGMPSGSCVGPVALGDGIDTTTVGAKSFVVVATDAVGNVAELTHHYGVVFDFEGFYNPVGNPPALNPVRAGQAITLKFSLGGDQGLDVVATGYPLSMAIDCRTGEPIDGTTLPASTRLRYDPTIDQYTDLWATLKPWRGTCRQFILMLADGTAHLANFSFR
jgi:hypothetical protein